MINEYQRKKLNKILIIVAVVLLIIAIVVGVVLATKGEKKPIQISYKDTIIGKNLYTTITIDIATKKVTRDGIDTTLQKEFEIDDAKANLLLNSTEELTTFFQDSTIDIELKDGKINLKNPYQTRILFVEADNITDNFNAEEILIQDGLYMLRFDSQKRTKAAYEFLKSQEGIKNIYTDDVMQIETINDESQTVYGQINKEHNAKTHGAVAMGIDNYKKIITDNGNPAQIVVATIGYGAAIDNKYFENKISPDYYDFITDSKEVKETIPQGSRILEVIKESTTDNVKILPLVVINSERYTTISSIAQALTYATEKADVICYEFVHKKNAVIELLLKNAFKVNKPVCCVTKPVQEGEALYPATDGTTIAVSSVDKSLKTTSYSASGDYIDFVASSTDIEEIFNKSSSVSRWSGAGYSNAHIASIIALIKTYNKEYTILEIYNTIRNYCKDLGNKGKDIIYGYGFPDFSNIKIADIDKTKPEIEEIKVDNEKWEKSKNINIKAKDNIRIYGWNVTRSKDVPKDWKKLDKIINTLDEKYEIKENGTYFIWVVDSAGIASYLSVDVTKVDNKEPIVQIGIDDSKLNTEKTITATVTANDEQSGLHQMPYSWDKQNWGVDNRILIITKNGQYKVYVRDTLGNTAERKITINSFPEEGTSEIDDGEIIKNIKVSSNWRDRINKEVTITFNDNLSVAYWKIADTTQTPYEFQSTENEFEPEESTNAVNQNTTSQQGNVQNNTSQGRTNMTITVEAEANKKYYLWIRDTSGNIKSQGFTIRKP